LLAGQPAERVRYLVTLTNDNEAPLIASITQYLVLNGRSAYVITYATRTDLIEKYNAVFEQSASSLRFIGQ
jgi:hypothetical protein